MGKMRWMMGSLLGAAMIMGSIGSAEARPRYGYGGYHDRYRHHDRGGFGFGDAVGVAALVGAVAIVASSLSKDRKASQGDAPRDRSLDANAPPPADGTDYGSDIRSGDSSDNGPADRYANACADAARQEASGDGGYAEVRRMDEPQVIDGGYNIDGEVELRAAYGNVSGTTRRFTCTVKDGRVADMYLSRDMVVR